MNADPSNEPFFAVVNLCQAFGGHRILEGVSFSVPRKKTTVILGGSGAGKSVLLRHLNGLMKPASGRIFVEGTDLGPLSERQLQPIRRKIGVLFQDGALFDSFNVGDNVAFPLRERGEKDHRLISDRVAEMLDLVGLRGHESKMPDSISGGMRKRVALARAMAAKPECLLYDEPTAGLDPVLSESITRLIRRLQEDLHLTSVVVTHNLGAMRFIADQVIFLKDGVVRYAGSPEGFESSGDEAIREFVSSDAMGRD